MNKLISPLWITILIALLIGLFNFTNFAETVNYFGLAFCLLFFTLFIHELGHALFGIWSGYRFNYLTVGPITLEKMERLRLKVNKSWFLVGGVANCSPLSNDLTTIAKQHKLFVAGGPIFTFIAAIISLIAGSLLNINWVTYFGIFNLFIFIVTILPYKGTLKSDGRVLLELSKKGKEQEEYLISLLLFKEMNSPIHPTKWSIDLIERAKTMQPTVDNVMVCYILFYYTLIQEDYENASRLLEPFKQIPVTKENKMALQFINQIKQVDLIVGGNFDKATIHHLHQQLSPIDPFSYKRSQAILAKLEGNDKLVLQKIGEVEKEIKKGKHLFGFYAAEEQLTQLLKSKLMTLT